MSAFSIAFRGSYFIPEAHGFYEAAEGVLGVAFRPRGRFDYSLESEQMSIELDREGELAHIEVRLPKQNWLVVPRLSVPAKLCRSRAFFPIPAHQEGEEYLTNPSQNVLCVEFSPQLAWRGVEIADGIVVEIDGRYKLLRLWLLKITDDYGNRKELAWLKAGSLFLPHPI